MGEEEYVIGEEDAKDLLSAACRIQGDCAEARDSTKDMFKANERDSDFSIRVCVDGLLSKLMYKYARVEHEESEKIAFQIMLCVAFTRAHYIINDMCLTGDYSEALSLQRRQLEIILRLLELEKKPPAEIKKKAPNVRYLETASVGQLYGLLSEYNHFCTARVNDLLTVVVDGHLRGPSLLPQYSEEASGACIDSNMIIALFFLREALPILKAIYPGVDVSHEENLLHRAYYLAYSHGLIKIMSMS